jgi:hypothetical protein
MCATRAQQKNKVRGTAESFSQKRRLKVNTMPLVSFALPVW